MRRADRLFQIVQYLSGGRLVTAAQLAERLEVSLRTIYRDVADLMANGVPIEGEAGVGYVMREGYDLPPLMFTKDEIVALVAGARMLRAWGGLEMAAAAEEALIKIGNVLPPDSRERANSVEIHALAMGGMPDSVKATLDRTEAAIHARQRLEIGYRTEEGTDSLRVIQPLGLFFWGQVWTLVSWCELRNDFRVFRLDRISMMKEGGVFPAARNKSLARYLATRREREGNRPYRTP